MMLLDTLYLLCSNFYKRREKNSFRVSGVILLTGVFVSNVMFISFMVSDFNPEMLSSSSAYKSRYFIVGASMLVFIVLFYFRYFRITNYDKVYSRFDSLTDRTKTIIYTLSVIYVALSFGAMFGYAFYSAWLISNWSH
jgi:hypothetical protein